MITTIRNSAAKRLSLGGFVVAIVGALLVLLSLPASDTTAIVVASVGVLLGGFGVLMAVRVRCDSCHRRLSAMFPSGSLLLLWTAKQRCRACNGWL